MYFILSKLLLFLILPLTWVFALLIIALITKRIKRRRRLIIAVIIILYLFSIEAVAGLADGAWDYQPPTSVQRAPYSCAIVLGGFASTDKHGKGYFNNAADRFIQGMLLLSTGKVRRLMVTGGSGDLMPGSFKEATWAKARLQELKIPDSSILIEYKSRNTIENAKFSKRVLDSAHLQPPYLLVTSSFHMRRALMIFRKQGIDVIPYPHDYLEGQGALGIDSFIPDVSVFRGWSYYLKEMVGYVVDYYKK
jgi:uncharacterized SAM-binding protein YcdF (DUF218 family)